MALAIMSGSIELEREAGLPLSWGGARSISFGLSDIRSDYIVTLLNRNLFFRYTVGNCDPSTTNAYTQAYLFRANPPIVTNADPSEVSCLGGNDGSIVIISTDRNPYPGEVFEYYLFKDDTPVKPFARIGSQMVAENLTAGSYKILGSTDQGGCGDSIYHHVNVLQPTDAITTSAAGNDQIVCNATATITGNAVDATDEVGQWTLVSGSGTISNANSRTTTLSNLSVGANVFRWTITQEYGCTSSDDVIITRLDVTSADAGSDQIVCSSSASLSANAPGTGEKGSWSVVSGSGTFSNINSRTSSVSDLSEGDNEFRWTIEDTGENCSKPDAVKITYINTTAAQAGEDLYLCSNSAVLAGNTVGTNESGQWTVVSGAAVFADNSKFNTTVSGLSSGANVLRWSIRDNGNHCTAKTDDVTLTVSDLTISEVSAKRKNPDCPDSDNGEIVVTAIGGVAFDTGLDYKFTLSNGDEEYANAGQEVKFIGLEASVYSVTVEDQNCIKYSTSITITAPNPITGTLSETAISCHDSNDGALSIGNLSGGAGGYTYAWSTGSSANSISNLNPGNYYVDITDSKGCTKRLEKEVEAPNELDGLTVINDIACHDDGNGSIELDPSGGTAPYSFSWSDGSSGQDLSNAPAGTYSVTITDANNCTTDITSLTITEPSEVALTVASKNNVSCFNTATGSITLNSSGGVSGYEYSMDGTNWQSSSVFNDLTAGSYLIMMRDANGCDASLTTSLTQPPLLEGEISSTTEAQCGESNGSATLNVSGGTGSYSYQWKNSSGTLVGTSANLQNVPGGIYTATVTDENACSFNINANVSSEDGAEITASNLTSTSCFDSNDGRAALQLTGVGPFTVEWDNGETGPNPTELHPGTNVVSITDANGCTVVEQITVPHPDAVDYQTVSSRPATCADSEDGRFEIQGIGGSGGYTYSWSNGQTGTVLNNVQQGDYDLEITDNQGCTFITTVHVDGVSPLSVEAASLQRPTCAGDQDGSVTIQGVGGNGNYTYTWFDGATGTFHDQLSAGEYTIDITDGKGCQSQTTITIPDAENYSVSIDDNAICTGGTYVITSPTEGTAYSWESDNGFNSNESTVRLTEPGVYHLEVVNAKGCIAEDDFELTLSDDLLQADFLMISEAYVGDTVVLIDISWPIPERLEWGFPEGAEVLTSNKDYAEVIFREPGTYGIDMEVGLANCSDFYTQSLTILDAPKDSEGGRLTAEHDLIKAFKVSPNPSNGKFKIELELSEALSPEFKLIDLEGNQILLNAQLDASKSVELEVDASENKPGMYMLWLKVGGQTVVKRILILK
ncbi:T9SS type A sorting domain-containing protein [Fulvivirga ligni]|uniref:T9SS type A sorting domain-containing protein n=1 Tax=Fulvivirga ligni TaxID=2904246 RepID=UPI001F208323|nr:T9SS type A sorting domain-containing protein [Fulvivirga ligni]UII20009.1 T9SS type A sorting domain-containing protein [Fulvivirga ligni]